MYCTDLETHTARKAHRCDSCGDLIQPGEVYKRWRCYDGSVSTNRMHPECLQMHQDDADGYTLEFSRWGHERPHVLKEPPMPDRQELPPLPEPVHYEFREPRERFTADQMRAYALQAFEAGKRSAPAVSGEAVAIITEAARLKWLVDHDTAVRLIGTKLYSKYSQNE